MSEVKKIATREAFGETLVELGKKHPELVVLDADLAAATKTAVFKKSFPDRHFDCGIAEANMMGVAAGLSLVGKIPVASSFAMFATGRAYEHIALMRSIPGMVVMNPSDAVEAAECVRAAIEYVGPVYMRFGRSAVPVINDRPGYHFEMGKGIVLREGTDVTIVATGILVSSALEAAEKLAAEGISAEVINIHTIKPLDKELIINSAKKTGKVVTAEEHSVIGGLGSAVCESGSAGELLVKYGLDGNGVYNTVKNFVTR